MNTRRQNLGEDVPSQQNLLLRKEERFYSRLGGLLPARPLPLAILLRRSGRPRARAAAVSLLSLLYLQRPTVPENRLLLRKHGWCYTVGKHRGISGALRGGFLQVLGMRRRLGPKCSICAHDKRHLIEVALTYKTPLRVLAARFNISPHALWRHSKAHLSAAMRASILSATPETKVDLERLRVSESEGLLGSLLAQRARLQQHAEAAMEAGSIHVAVAAEGRITENLRLVSQLLGQLMQVHEVRHNILISGDYLRLREVLLRALRPHSAAARDVANALHQLEAEAAESIKANGAGGKRPLLIEHDAEAAA
jgi:hypothetical protein